ncbi:unnamed protein product [Cylicostephanus goldi]|uniref:Uncharacterized protein n=1 Tax=Cylicostephanus goldi TaxID=71465 RepID=A0A3P7PJA7_CYLGO|nr:unnamed protein product [Cylicostephanus goldi]
MVDSDQERVVATLKAYLKLCAKPCNRFTILKDQSFLEILKTLVQDDRVVVMTYLIKILLLLTENSDDAQVVCGVPEIERNLSNAAEKQFSPNIVYNLLVIVSRLKAAQNKIARDRQASAASQPSSIREVIGPAAPAPRKFVARKSKQLIYEFDELWDDLKNEIETQSPFERFSQ